MKQFLAFSLFFTLCEFAAAEQFEVQSGLSYTCTAKGRHLRQHDKYLPVDAELAIYEFGSRSGTRILNVSGHVSVDYVDSVDGEYCYQAVFELEGLRENRQFEPEVYLGFSQFRDFDATSTNDCDGGGMWGYFVVAKDTSEKTFLAHYLFSAGDHMGGTIDLHCKKELLY